jgi:transforming growth factor-beta-induced protein
MKTKSLLITSTLVTALFYGASASDCATKATSKNPMKSGTRLVEVAVAAGQFKTLAAALKAADLVDVLQGDGPFTVFAPTDAAFAKLPKGTVETLLKPENQSKLQEVLKYHVVAGRVLAKEALNVGTAPTLAGEPVRISLVDGRLQINRSKVLTTDLLAGNGVIHVIDTVLMPGDAQRMMSAVPPKDLVTLAIERGTPLFNHGQSSACAAIYEVTATALIRLPDDQVSVAAKTELSRALDRADNQGAEDKAWTLRRALDATLARLN